MQNVPQLPKLTLAILLTSSVLCNQRSMAVEGGAREFVDFSKTRTQRVFSIISKSEVQVDLHLTTNQITKLANIRLQQPKDIPSASNFLAQSKASANKEDRKRISDELWKAVDDYQLKSLFDLLSGSQSNRLRQITWQVDGVGPNQL